MFVRVITIHLATGKEHSNQQINFNRTKTKQWLDKHLTWCFKNGYGVQMLEGSENEPQLSQQP